MARGKAVRWATDVVGQSVNLSDDTYTIVGVLPREFSFAPRAIPSSGYRCSTWARASSGEVATISMDSDGLRDGVTVEAARADLKRIAAQLAAQYPGSNKDQGASVEPLAEFIVGNIRPILLTLLAGAGLLLVIACVNVASLLLVRAESRRREVAVRGAVGATQGRLVRQFVTEGLLLAVAGCARRIWCCSVWMMTRRSSS